MDGCCLMGRSPSRSRYRLERGGDSVHPHIMGIVITVIQGNQMQRIRAAPCAQFVPSSRMRPECADNLYRCRPTDNALNGRFLILPNTRAPLWHTPKAGVDGSNPPGGTMRNRRPEDVFPLACFAFRGRWFCPCPESLWNERSQESSGIAYPYAPPPRILPSAFFRRRHISAPVR